MRTRGGRVRTFTRKTIKKLAAIAEGVEDPQLRIAEHFGQKQPIAISPEQLRTLRHFRPAYLRTRLSTVLQVGAGRSRLSL